MNEIKEFLKEAIAQEDEQIEPYLKQLKEIEETIRDIKIKLRACESRKFAYCSTLEQVEAKVKELHGAN